MKHVGQLLITLAASAAILPGCITHPQNPAATQPSTVIDLATTQPSYWLSQPPQASVDSGDFDRLWAASEQTARDFLFQLDRQDFRSGILTTKPLVSAQWFEPWRPDIHTIHDLEESSEATIRRTIQFEFTKQPDGTFMVAPKVLVERQTIAENRITSVTTYNGIFNAPRNPTDAPMGTVESDEGLLLRPRYWYALGRDAAFEKVLAEAVSNKMKPR